jgi:hypothetical protein
MHIASERVFFKKNFQCMPDDGTSNRKNNSVVFDRSTSLAFSILQHNGMIQNKNDVALAFT